MRRALLALLLGTAALGVTAEPHCPVTGTAPPRRGGDTAPKRVKVGEGGGETSVGTALGDVGMHGVVMGGTGMGALLWGHPGVGGAQWNRRRDGEAQRLGCW